jgi:hypothetical protein
MRIEFEGTSKLDGCMITQCLLSTFSALSVALRLVPEPIGLALGRSVGTANLRACCVRENWSSDCTIECDMRAIKLSYYLSSTFSKRFIVWLSVAEPHP